MADAQNSYTPPDVTRTPVAWQWRMVQSGNWATVASEKFARACAESAGTAWRALYAGPTHETPDGVEGRKP